MKITAFATIKLDSQRVPRKNLQILGKHELCYYAPKMALDISDIDDVYVYCSDKTVKDYIPKDVHYLKRSKWLDGDEIKAKDVYSEFIREIDSDIYIALLTTAPFIKSCTLENSLNKVIDGEFDSAFCVKRCQSFAWYKGVPLNFDPGNIPKTQDLAPVLVETSGFFIFTKELWLKYGRRIGFKPYIQELGEIESVDIDTPEDLQIARAIAQNVLFI